MHETVPKLMELFSDPAGLDFLVSSALDPAPQVPISAISIPPGGDTGDKIG